MDGLLWPGRTLRIETVINSPRDLACNTGLPNLDELQGKARSANNHPHESGL